MQHDGSIMDDYDTIMEALRVSLKLNTYMYVRMLFVRDLKMIR